MKPFYLNQKSKLKNLLLETLWSAGKPLSVGELYLITGRDQELIRRYLKELQQEGLVDGSIKKMWTTLYNGTRMRHNAVLWSFQVQNILKEESSHE